MHVQPYDSIEHLQRLRRRKAYQAITTRLQIIILAKQGHTAPQIVQALGLSRRPVQQWVHRYNAQGIDGLYDRARTGQPTKLPADQQPALKQRLLAGPPMPTLACARYGDAMSNASCLMSSAWRTR